MARRVIMTAIGPVKLGPSEKPISICACGLSRTFPICDGAHKTTSKLEDPSLLYEYDPTTLAVTKSEPWTPPQAPPPPPTAASLSPPAPTSDPTA